MATPEQRKSVRSEGEGRGDQWDIASSVGYTALLVAGWRAVHTASPHPLAADQYAGVFITASGDPYLTGLLAHPPATEDATVFPRLYGVQTRFFDEFFRSATNQGIRQAVILAAGLDSRAYRLDWPAGTTVFEVDQPKVLEFKARVLAAHGAQPKARRREVAVDLREDWSDALTAAGFERERPAAWSMEGLLPYLTGAAQDALFACVDDLSALGSQLAVGALGSGFHRAQLAALEVAHPGLAMSGDVDFSTLTYSDDTKTKPAAWLTDHGWAVHNAGSSPDLQASYGRTPPEVDVKVDAILHSEYLIATR
ncbi:MAG: class I SAM-dependent methyltransferase [Mycobacterium sp.]